MPGIYHPRHPQKTVLYRVLFHHFERFVAEYERFEKAYGCFRPIIKEVVERYIDGGRGPGLCPGVHFRREGSSLDHLKLTFVAEKPPPSRVLTDVALMAAETSAEYLS